MKKLLSSLVACFTLIACLSLTSCSDTIGRNNLIGTWSGYDSSGSMVLTFKKANKFDMQLQTIEYQHQYMVGTYTHTESSFVLDIESVNDIEVDLKMAFDYVMDTDGMSMTIYDIYGNAVFLKKY